MRHIPVLTPPAGGPPTVIFVADFTYAPNADALDYVTGEVMPAAWALDPELRLLVVGKGIETAPSDLRIVAPGFVDDLEEWYAKAHAVCVPLRIGGGSPLKFMEALAHALPTVTTPHAAALLERGVAGQDFLVGADAAEMGRLLVDAARGAHAGVAAAGRDVAEREYSFEALTELVV